MEKMTPKTEEGFEERRKTQRLPISFKLRYKLKGRRNFWNEARSRDISGGGIGLVADEDLKINDKAEVLFYLDSKSDPITALCVIRWCQKAEEDKFRAGLKFMKIKEYQRFAELLCDKMLKLSLV